MTRPQPATLLALALLLASCALLRPGPKLHPTSILADMLHAAAEIRMGLNKALDDKKISSYRFTKETEKLKAITERLRLMRRAGPVDPKQIKRAFADLKEAVEWARRLDAEVSAAESRLVILEGVLR